MLRQGATRVDLPLGRGAPAAARRAVRDALAGCAGVDPQWLDDAVLIADELVANAVRHGGGCLRLQIRVNGEDVTLVAIDGSAVVPRRRHPDGTGGRGLAIIEALARGWGVTDLDGGHKAVWVRLAPLTSRPTTALPLFADRQQSNLACQPGERGSGQDDAITAALPGRGTVR